MAFNNETKGGKSIPVESGLTILESKCKNIVGLNTQPDSLQWDDKYFYDNYVSKLIKYCVPVYDDAANAAKYFLNFYVFGDYQLPDLITATTQLFYYMTVNGKRVVDSDYLIGDNTWDALPRPHLIRDAPSSVLFHTQKPQDSNANVTRVFKVMRGKSITLNQDMILRWYTSLFGILDRGDQMVGISVINYLGFLAGILCRISVKDPEAVCDHIVATTVDRYFSIFGTTLNVNFIPPPNTKSCQAWAQDLRKMSPGCNQLLTILITAKVCTPTTSKNDVEGLLKAMCLLSLSAVGLEALNWANKAAECTQMDL